MIYVQYLEYNCITEHLHIIDMNKSWYDVQLTLSDYTPAYFIKLNSDPQELNCSAQQHTNT